MLCSLMNRVARSFPARVLLRLHYHGGRPKVVNDGPEDFLEKRFSIVFDPETVSWLPSGGGG